MIAWLKGWSGVGWFLALIAFDGVIIQQWLPVWLGMIIFCAPTVLFVASIVFAMIDPLWLVSVRESQTGEKRTSGFGRKRA